MNIIHHIRNLEEQKEELEDIVRKYKRLVRTEIIIPDLIPEDIDVDYFRSSGRSIIIENEDEIINGILTYKLVSLRQLQQPAFQNSLFSSLYNTQGNRLENVDFSTLPGFGGNLSDIYAFVEEMESFTSGTGNKLLAEVKTESIQGIFLQSLGRAEGFYKRMGFNETGVYGCHNPGLPLLVWRKNSNLSR